MDTPPCFQTILQRSTSFANHYSISWITKAHPKWVYFLEESLRTTHHVLNLSSICNANRS